MIASLTARLDGYHLSGPRWTTSTITVHLQLGGTSTPLLDGSPTWAASADEALTLWNVHLTTTRFSSVRDSTAPIAPGNNTNNVLFSDTVYGDAWGSGVLAVAIYYTSGGGTTMRECDVLFNSRLSWNSYRGPLQGGVYDFRRVALHEFGHVLGLNHPDAIGQNVVAIMNSRIGNLDTLAEDDINGARALYGGSTVLPPSITSHPLSRTVLAGQTVSFSVTATGTAPLAHQWMKSGTPISGATSSTLTLANVTQASAGTYAVTVSNAAGTATSMPATLTVNTTPPPPVFLPPPPPVLVAPTIAVSPVSRTVNAGETVTFSVVANGTAPLAYRWQKAGVNISGATGSSYTIAPVQPGDAGTYAVVVSNAIGSITSTAATLVVNSAPLITTQPADVTVVAGSALTLAVVATARPAPAYQWEKDGVALSGASSAAFTLPAAGAADAGLYRVRVANSLGSVVSSAARVTVHVPPEIVVPPSARTVIAGESVTFAVEASGLPPPVYQWRKDGGIIPGATGPSYTVGAAQPEDAGSYSVVVTNVAGSVTSRAVSLDVRFSRIVNLSTRGFIPAGDALTTGFVIRGSGAKQLVIRGIGPGLRAFGLEGVIDEAWLEVVPDGPASAALPGDDWSAGKSLAEAFARVGAFPLPDASRDAALTPILQPRAYTVRTTAGNAQPGIALAEIYDADPLDAAARLINASTLGFAGTGESALMPGIVIRGSAPKRLLLRAIGPGLARFGVAGVLANPRLLVIPSGTADPVAGNDDWGGAPELRAAFERAGAFALEDGSRDAAVAVTLPPGAYSVVVAGADGGTGRTLVEIYDLDP
jgi:hypothetical protein